MTDRRAWGWVQHLRHGGSTPWADWAGTAEPGGAVVPGAQQLELLRRLNQAGAPGPLLVQRVLGASAPGRGQPDLELLGAAAESRFGPRPVDPGALPDGELLRVAASILAEDVVARGLPGPPRVGPAPAMAAPLPPATVTPSSSPRCGPTWSPGAGRPADAPRSTWFSPPTSAGCSRTCGLTAPSTPGSPAGGPGFGGWSGDGALPSRIDPLHLARNQTGRTSPDRIHVVLDPEAVGPLVGVRRPLAQPPELSAEARELGRRIGAVVGLLVPPDQRKALMRETLRPWLAEQPGSTLGVPVEHHGWLRDHAARIAEGLSRAGYAVHGDPGGLAPVGQPDVEAPTPRTTLALAMRMMLAGGSGPDTSKEEE